jgi:hypothetical protein
VSSAGGGAFSFDERTGMFFLQARERVVLGLVRRAATSDGSGMEGSMVGSLLDCEIERDTLHVSGQHFAWHDLTRPPIFACRYSVLNAHRYDEGLGTSFRRNMISLCVSFNGLIQAASDARAMLHNWCLISEGVRWVYRVQCTL